MRLRGRLARRAQRDVHHDGRQLQAGREHDGARRAERDDRRPGEGGADRERAHLHGCGREDLAQQGGRRPALAGGELRREAGAVHEPAERDQAERRRYGRGQRLAQHHEPHRADRTEHHPLGAPAGLQAHEQQRPDARAGRERGPHVARHAAVRSQFLRRQERKRDRQQAETAQRQRAGGAHAAQHGCADKMPQPRPHDREQRLAGPDGRRVHRRTRSTRSPRESGRSVAADAAGPQIAEIVPGQRRAGDDREVEARGSSAFACASSSSGTITGIRLVKPPNSGQQDAREQRDPGTVQSGALPASSTIATMLVAARTWSRIIAWRRRRPARSSHAPSTGPVTRLERDRRHRRARQLRAPGAVQHEQHDADREHLVGEPRQRGGRVEERISGWRRRRRRSPWAMSLIVSQAWTPPGFSPSAPADETAMSSPTPPTKLPKRGCRTCARRSTR